MRALSKALTVIDNDLPDKQILLQDLYGASVYGGQSGCHVVGITGSPGAGKSSLVDRLTTTVRAAGLTVAVIAVDPSSPFTGGALLGDRVRMVNHAADPGVFIRSVSSRGQSGGLSRTAREMLIPLSAYGPDVVFIETVGAGQSELDIMSAADTVLLVLTPGAGDLVQTAKAGIMEIADVFVVNKADLPGSEAMIRELTNAVNRQAQPRENWHAPVIRTVAADGSGLDDLWAAIQSHRQHLHQPEFAAERIERRRRELTKQLVESAVVAHLAQRCETDDVWRRILNDTALTPYERAQTLLAMVWGKHLK